MCCGDGSGGGDASTLLGNDNATSLAVHDRLLAVAALFGANGGDIRSAAAAAAAAAFYAAGHSVVSSTTAPPAPGPGGLTSPTVGGYHMMTGSDALPVSGERCFL